MFTRNKIGLAVSAATAMFMSTTAFAEIPPVNAIADAMLNLSNFQIRTASGGQLGTGGQTQNGVQVTGATTTHNSSTNINGIDGLNWKNINGGGLVRDCSNVACTQNSTSEVVGLGTTIIYYSTIGNLGNWNKSLPYSNDINSGGLTQFARAQSDSAGNAIENSDAITVHSTAVVTSGNQTANSAAQQNLSSSFNIVTLDTVTLRLSFLAEGYLRTALGQSFFDPANLNNAFASFSWSATLTGTTLNAANAANGTANFSWSPDGNVGTGMSCGGVGGGAAVSCTEIADAFKMTQSLNAQGLKQDQTTSGPDFLGIDLTEVLSGRFEATLTLPKGIYSFGIGHTTQADVQTPPLPVPGTLALLGIGLLGLGMKVRRRVGSA